MIAQLTGKLIHKEPAYLLLEVGNIGYALHISLHTFAQIKTLTECTLQTVMHVKQETPILYGFATLEEKAWWLRLIAVSSIGPKTALTILSFLTPLELHRAILDKKEQAFTAIKGVGFKAAQRLILELTDQVKKLPFGIGDGTLLPQQRETANLDQDALIALTTLGLTHKIAEKAIAKVRAEVAMPLTLEELLKRALQGV